MQSQEAAAKNKRNSESDVSAKVLAMYAGTRTPSMEPQWLAAGLSQSRYHQAKHGRRYYLQVSDLYLQESLRY